MPSATSADTIRILVSTDNHVGYNERDAIRGDDSWKTFHEVMCLAKERDVDMVLLAGDLFHENKPSRKSMYQVMRSLRMNCYGEKPCELEMLSDASEQFAGAFNHVNYEDPDINVAIPVFSIHGNHDDPSGEGHLAALDILQMSGLINYYGRTPESDNINIKPVLLQKGQTKLALFGMSNVRDERLFRTFRDGQVRFFRPNAATDEWFNILSVHQNHHAYTETGYLPESLLPDFMDLVVWGHEHECKIEPTLNPQKGFKVMQPGSSVATSLAEGEQVPKHVAILSVTGRDFSTELIRLKTVRPFVYKEIALQNDKKLCEAAIQSADNQAAVNRYCMKHIDDMIEQAKQDWLEAQKECSEEPEDDQEVPLPLIRLRVEFTAPDGGNFNIDNPQRFSGRYVGKVANTSDVIQYHRKKATATRRARANDIDEPDRAVNNAADTELIKVDQLVKEYLEAQTLTILPQNRLGDAVIQYVDKDDKHSLEEAILESLASQVNGLLGSEEDNEVDEDTVTTMMETIREQLEERFTAGDKALKKRRNRKPRPAGWDSDEDGAWEDDPASLIRKDAEDDEDNDDDDDDEGQSAASRTTAARGRGRGRGGRGPASTTTRKPAAKKAPAKAKAPAKTTAKSRKKAQESEEEGEEDDVIMLDDDDEDDDVPSRAQSPGLFMTQEDTQPAPKAKKTTRVIPAAAKKTPARATRTHAASARQTQLNFSQTSARSGTGTGRVNGSSARRVQEPSDDEIDDDDDAFEPPPPSARAPARRR